MHQTVYDPFCNRECVVAQTVQDFVSRRRSRCVCVCVCVCVCALYYTLRYIFIYTVKVYIYITLYNGEVRIVTKC